ncbi:hypothetical protein [Scytonema sp. NUACC21]
MSDERGSGRLYCKMLESAKKHSSTKIQTVISAWEIVTRAFTARYTQSLYILGSLASSVDILQMWVETPLAVAQI